MSNIIEKINFDNLKYLFTGQEKNLEKQIFFGNGYNFLTGKKGAITVPDVNRSGHFWCFGTTRVGKTRLLENMTEEDIRKGYNVIVFDPKGDVELFSKIAQVAIECNRKDDLMLMSTTFPEYSIRINPLEYYSMVEELVGHVLAAIPESKEPFFKNVAYETTINAIIGLIKVAQAQKESSIVTFEDLKDNTERENLEALNTLLEGLHKNNEGKSIDKEEEELNRIIKDLKMILQSEKDYFSKISSSLRVALMELSKGNIGTIVGTAKGNEVIRRLQESLERKKTDEKPKGVILVVQAGSLLTDRAARTVCKVLISMIAKLAGRVFASGRKLPTPLCLYLDEAQSMLYGGIDDLFAKAGGAGVWIHCFSQSINQIYNEMPSKDAGKAILDNTNTKVFMRAPDAETADSVAKFFGEQKKYSPVFNTNSGGMTIKESVDSVITPQHILEMQPRQFFMTSYNGMYRGLVRPVSDLILNIEYPIASNISASK